jgi:hypothetical protein
MPPQNSGYMYAAYGAAITIYTLYAVSIWWRARALARRAARAIGTRGRHDAR